MNWLKRLCSPVSPAALRDADIVGMNRRNIELILPLNKRKYYPRVDNKALTKLICRDHGIACADTYAIIESNGQLREFESLLANYNDFVIKPASGAAGRGIVVVLEKTGDGYITAGRETMTYSELRYHVSCILTGLFSLGGHPDTAIIEQRILPDPVFEKVAVRGTPDIRVILYKGIPVMAMTRLPTNASRGKANLHQGAIGAGINLITGKTNGGVCRNLNMTHHPDTGESIADFEIPRWDDVIDITIRLAKALELGYVGVDIVIDHNKGPLVLEANARPGLAIQVANRQGLWTRIKAVDELPVLPVEVDDIKARVNDLAIL